MTPTAPSASTAKQTARGAAGCALLIDGRAETRGIDDAIRDLAAWASGRGHAVCLPRALAGAFASGAAPAGVQVHENEAALAAAAPRLDPAPGLVVTLGGDGALMRGIERYGRLGAAFLGVNLGSVGFTASVLPERLIETLDAWAEGRAPTCGHRTLHARILRGERQAGEALALNDIVLQRGSVARMLEIRVDQGGQRVLAFHADGLVIASATGSTAYGLSTGGPIVHPSVPGVVVSGLGAYTMAHRAIVLPAAPELRASFIPREAGGRATLHIDGQSHRELEREDEIAVGEGPALRIVNPPGFDYFETLRRKLHWCAPIKPLSE